MIPFSPWPRNFGGNCIVLQRVVLMHDHPEAMDDLAKLKLPGVFIMAGREQSHTSKPGMDPKPQGDMAGKGGQTHGGQGDLPKEREHGVKSGDAGRARRVRARRAGQQGKIHRNRGRGRTQGAGRAPRRQALAARLSRWEPRSRGALLCCILSCVPRNFVNRGQASRQLWTRNSTCFRGARRS